MRLTWFAVVLACSCGGAQYRTGTEPVELGPWCEAMGQTFCSNMQDQCMDGLSGFADGCFSSFVPNCLAGRDANADTGRTYDDLAYCRSILDQSECSELGQNVAAMGTGQQPRCLPDVQ